MVTLGCMPVKEHVSIEKGIDCWKNFGTHYFLERREIGIFNIGGAGSITADGVEYRLGYKDCLYITKGTKKVNSTLNCRSFLSCLVQKVIQSGRLNSLEK